jgi:LacI family transcriptional regulator
MQSFFRAYTSLLKRDTSLLKVTQNTAATWRLLETLVKYFALLTRMVPLVIQVHLGSNPFLAVEVLRGMGDAALRRPGWRIQTAHGTPLRPRDLLAGEPDAVVLLHHYAMADALRRFPKPLVCLFHEVRHAGAALVVPDEQAIGRLGARHLHGLGIRQVLFLGTPEPWSTGREQGFSEEATRLGMRLAALADCPEGRWRLPWDLVAIGQVLRQALRGITGPIGLMAANDLLAATAIDAALAAGLRVPDQVAVLGVDDSITICQYHRVPISSIDVNAYAIGAAAITALQQLVDRPGTPPEPVLVEPKGVVHRRSSDMLAVDDPDVASALRYIRERACDGINVDDVLERVAISRTGLDRKMKQAVGRTASDEIERIRMAEARRLVEDSDLPMADVAARTGFSCLSHFSHAFRRAFGQPPRGYRQGKRR